MATHHFSTEDASRYGLEESIVLHNIGYWCATNLAKRQNIHDGRVWTYNPISAWLELTPYLCPAKDINPEDFQNTEDYDNALARDKKRRVEKVRTIFKSLEDQGAIVIGNYNKNPYDQTRWYSLTNQNDLTKYAVIDPQALKTLNPEISGMHRSPFQKSLDCTVQKSLDCSSRYKTHIKNATTTEKPQKQKVDFDVFALALIGMITNMIDEGGWVTEGQPIPKATWLRAKAQTLYDKFPDPRPEDCAVIILRDWTSLLGKGVKVQTDHLPVVQKQPEESTAPHGQQD